MCVSWNILDSVARNVMQRGGAEVCLVFSDFTMYRIRASYVNFVLLLKKLPIIRGVLLLRKLPITRDVLDLMFCC